MTLTCSPFKYVPRAEQLKDLQQHAQHALIANVNDITLTHNILMQWREHADQIVAVKLGATKARNVACCKYCLDHIHDVDDIADVSSYRQALHELIDFFS